MTDEEIFSFNQAGFIPGPYESKDQFIKRIEATKQAYVKLGVASIPPAHFEWVEKKLLDLFDFSPKCLPAFYSNRALRPWQGAAAWVERGQVLAIQLRESFKKGSFLGIYKRSEILAHEAVHAARSAFPYDPWDEYFAYMTSGQAWRRVLGPIIQRPWEVWPFLIFCLLGPMIPIAFIAAAFWTSLGFIRLISRHLILRKASKTLQKKGYSEAQARYILFRLRDAEIRSLAKGKDLETNESLNSRLIQRYIYGTKNHR